MRERGPKPTCHVSGGTEPGFTLNKLRHDDFHEICGLVERVREIIPDDIGPLVGMTVQAPDGTVGKVTGYAVDTETKQTTRVVRVNGKLYHVDVLTSA